MTDAPHFRSAVPALPVADQRRAVAFYEDALGLRLVHNGDGFAVLVRDDVELHLWVADGSAPGAESHLAGSASCRIQVTQVGRLYQDCDARGVVHPNAPLRDTPWGTREFGALDPDGNLVTLFQRPSTDRPRPRFARMYERVSPGMEAEGMAGLRDELVANLSGDVIEVGAGNGMNFSHYPRTVTSVLAVEPEPYLRGLAERAAHRADVPVTVVAGRAEQLPADDASADAGVVSLMLCALTDQDVALGELARVIKPGGQLRFLEHVAAEGRGLRLVQRVADATVWPLLTGGCRTARDPVGAITRAGFDVRTVRRLRFPDAAVPVPAAPHVLGIARRP